MSVSIEDEYQDVLKKAAIGLRLSHSDLALSSGLNLKQVRALIDGNFSEIDARKLAPILGLDADKLVDSLGVLGYLTKFLHPDSISVTSVSYTHLTLPTICSV